MTEDDEDESELQVDFIPAYEDAKLRLECFRTAGQLHPSWTMEGLLKEAQQIYNWVMEVSEAAEEPAAKTPEDKCERRH